MAGKRNKMRKQALRTEQQLKKKIGKAPNM